jgi:exosome complex RNA-binding protein Rrp4
MKYNVEYAVDGDVIIGKICTVSGEKYFVKVPQKLMDRWKRGESVQNVFHMLDADQREFFMTGITPKEWEHMFGINETK